MNLFRKIRKLEQELEDATLGPCEGRKVLRNIG